MACVLSILFFTLLSGYILNIYTSNYMMSSILPVGLQSPNYLLSRFYSLRPLVWSVSRVQPWGIWLPAERPGFGLGPGEHGVLGFGVLTHPPGFP